MNQKNTYFLVGLIIALFIILLGFFLNKQRLADDELQGVMLMSMNINEESPEWLVYETKPGDVITDSVLVYNPNKETALHVKLNASDATQTVDGDFTLLNPDSTENIYYKDWVRLSKNELDLEPGAWEVVDFELSVPKGADLAAYEGGIVAVLESNENQAIADLHSDLDVNYQIGLRLYLTVTENPEKFVTAPRELDFGSKPYLLWSACITAFALLLSAGLYFVRTK